MKENDKELLKTFPSMFKGVAVQVAQLNGSQNASLSFDDVCKMATFSLALGCQISEADNSNRGKVIAEGVIGGTLTTLFNFPHPTTAHWKPKWPSWHDCIT